MKKRRLGRSPIYVSEICMGTMTFGSGADEAMSHKIMDESVEAGINFFDTGGKLSSAAQAGVGRRDREYRRPLDEGQGSRQSDHRDQGLRPQATDGSNQRNAPV